MSRTTLLPLLAAIAAPLALAGCGDGPATPATAQQAPQEQEVGIVTLEPRARPQVKELPGRIAPTRIAEVRARVSGIVLERKFEQGSKVAAGDILYRLDPAPYQVELRAAQAALAKARASLELETRNAERMEALAKTQAVSRSQVETAIATKHQAEAEAQAQEAAVSRANLNLAYTEIRAPIGGYIGRALVSEGALVGQNEATHLATIQQLGAVYADFTQSVSELNQLKRDVERGELENANGDAASVRLLLDDGAVYAQGGKLLFSDTTVDPSTGQVTLRGEFANPSRELLPGMYVRVQIVQGIDPDALSVPQQAVRRNDAGAAEVFVLRDDNRAAVQAVRVGRAVEGHWQLLDGVKPGDKVIVDGFQKFVAGDVVRPTAWQTELRQASAASTKKPN